MAVYQIASVGALVFTASMWSPVRRWMLYALSTGYGWVVQQGSQYAADDEEGGGDGVGVGDGVGDGEAVGDGNVNMLSTHESLHALEDDGDGDDSLEASAEQGAHVYVWVLVACLCAAEHVR